MLAGWCRVVSCEAAERSDAAERMDRKLCLCLSLEILHYKQEILFKHFGLEERLLFKYFGLDERFCPNMQDLYAKIWIKSKAFCCSSLILKKTFSSNIFQAKQDFS